MENARRQAAVNLQGRIVVPFYLSPWSNRGAEAYAEQWAPVTEWPYPEGRWDWPEWFRRYQNDPSAMSIVVWGPDDRLSAIALLTTTGEAVCVRVIEGDPRPDCPLAGKRVLIVLEAAACYVQALGRREIRLEPMNQRLTDLYTNVYRFTLEKPKRGAPYYRKVIP